MKDQHTKITGYRDLNENEIDLINRIKAAGKDLETLFTDLDGRAGLDKRWLAIARTDFQTGLMAAVRAVAQPETF